jgi:hypothetical protein
MLSWMPLSVRTVCILWGTPLISAVRKLTAVITLAIGCSWAKANSMWIDRHEEGELTLLSDVDVKVADWVAFERLLGADTSAAGVFIPS